MNEVRWKQRFQNFKKAFDLMISAVEKPNLSRLEKEGLIQRFEYTFELAWKTLRDYMRFGGVETDLPRDVIKEAFANGLIKDGQTWIDMLDKRNLMSHVYDESAFEAVHAKVIGEYCQAIRQLHDFLTARVGS